MRIARRILAGGVAGVGLGCVALTGCQTYPAGFGGMTLPSPHYLKHYPQYTPPEPVFPLQRELDSMLDPAGLGQPGGGRPGVSPLPPAGPYAPPAPVLQAAPPANPAGPGNL